MEVRYSKFAISDLDRIKYNLLQSGDSIQSVVILSQMINKITEIKPEDCKYSEELDYDYFEILDKIIFFRKEDDKIIVDRIIEKDNEIIKNQNL